MFSLLDTQMMQRALALAERGRFTNHPNPRVGCVIAVGERIVGEGWHRKWGEAHAEVNALQAAGSAAQGATAYVTLEPHSYHGRTPPCTEALIRAGVARVVCAALDPNPQVLGSGVRQLEQAGIRVECGLLENEARRLNLGFEKRMQRGIPRVTLKIAASIDGRVALANGASRWITGEAARADVQRLRAATGAVLTGIDTVLADDPQLTVRDTSIDTLGRQPIRVVLDSSLRMPEASRMLREPGETLIMTRAAASDAALKSAGAKVVRLPSSNDTVDLNEVLLELGRRQCNDVLIEAGPTLAGRFLELHLVDEMIVYVAPKVLGPDARAMLKLPALNTLNDAPGFILQSAVPVGDDVKLVYVPRA